ncbi:Multifunctional conjugation protein TraI [compost metagenome]
MVIQPEKDYPKIGLVRGETYRVKEALPGNTLVLQGRDGSSTTINPRKLTKLSVYHSECAELAVGDTVRINRNDPGRDLTNGDRMLVASVTGGIVRIESIQQNNGQPKRSLELLGTKPLHLEHAYASTVHSSQGLTNDRALIALDTKSRTTSMNLYYVAISRARHEARVYTNSISELPAAIARRFDKSTALAVQRERLLNHELAGMPAKSAADGKQLLQRQPREPERRQHGER